MLVSMESRGPDSAGFAIYNSDKNKIYKYSICLNGMSFEKFKKEIKNKVKITNIEKNSDHVILKSIEKPNKILPILEDFSTISLVGYGKSIEIFKQVIDYYIKLSENCDILRRKKRNPVSPYRKEYFIALG